MLTKTIVAALALAGCALAAPPASAAQPWADCSFRSVQQDAAGPAFQGYGLGFVVAQPGDAVAVSCEIRVNGVTASRTPTGSGWGAAVTAGLVSFVADEDDWVEVCTVLTVNGTTTTACPSRYWWPPDVWSALDPLLRLVYEEVLWGADQTVCPMFAALPGTYGPLVVNEQGDVYLAGEPQWDCPPYDIWPAA